MTDTDPERQLMAMRSAAAGHLIDTDQAWRDLQRHRVRAGRNRRKWLAAAAAAASVAVAATAVPVLAGSLPASPVRATPPVSGPPGGRSSAPASPGTYPGAIVARIPVAGIVSLVEDEARVWAVRVLARSGTSSYQLVRIDLRTNKVTLRADLGASFRAVAAGGGTVWLNTTLGRAKGQLQRIDPATGRVLTTLHLPTGHCNFVTYSAGRLWAECADGDSTTTFLRINPVTGRVDGRAGPVRGPIGPIVAGAEGVWYVTGTGIRGLVGLGSRLHAITVNGSGYPSSLAYADSLVFGQGAIWALTSDESVAKIDPATGRIVRTFTYRSYDPAYQGGLGFLAVGQKSLWFLDDALPSGGVLRVSMVTGQPVGRVADIGSCGEPCHQIYVTPSAVWMPTQNMLVRIDPGRLPG